MSKAKTKPAESAIWSQVNSHLNMILNKLVHLAQSFKPFQTPRAAPAAAATSAATASTAHAPRAPAPPAAAPAARSRESATRQPNYGLTSVHYCQYIVNIRRDFNKML